MSAPLDVKLPHVTGRTNKDGTVRYYFFRRGQPVARLPGTPGSMEFAAEYDRCKNWVAPHKATYAGSFDELSDRYMESSAFTTKAAATKAARKRIILSMMKEPLERGQPERFGQERADRIGPAHIEVLRDRKADNPNAANERLKILAQIFKFAKRKPNPVRDVERLRTPKGGHETATDEQIAAYEGKHTGGPARLAMAILKHTGVRVSDLRILGRQHIKGGLLCFTTAKTQVLCELTISPELAAELPPPRNQLTFLLSDNDEPYASDKALSQRIAKWFRQAGVLGVTAHGVRKWRATKMAEGGATEYQLMAWFGWSDAKEAKPYVQSASRRKLAREAGEKMANV